MKDNRINYDLERKLRRYAIGNLMKYIVIGQGIVFALMYIWPTLGYRLYSLISLTRAGLMRGQIWRLVTFVFTPPSSSPIFILFALYFYYMIGLGLENQWGKVKFNLYYAVGMLGSIIAALITGYGSNMFLNLSLFFAYAALYPDEQVLLFMFLSLIHIYLPVHRFSGDGANRQLGNLLFQLFHARLGFFLIHCFPSFSRMDLSPLYPIYPHLFKRV